VVVAGVEGAGEGADALLCLLPDEHAASAAADATPARNPRREMDDVVSIRQP
jgi:hypothetical protein